MSSKAVILRVKRQRSSHADTAEGDATAHEPHAAQGLDSLRVTVAGVPYRFVRITEHDWQQRRGKAVEAAGLEGQTPAEAPSSAGVSNTSYNTAAPTPPSAPSAVAPAPAPALAVTEDISPTLSDAITGTETKGASTTVSKMEKDERKEKKTAPGPAEIFSPTADSAAMNRSVKHVPEPTGVAGVARRMAAGQSRRRVLRMEAIATCRAGRDAEGVLISAVERAPSTQPCSNRRPLSGPGTAPRRVDPAALGGTVSDDDFLVRVGQRAGLSLKDLFARVQAAERIANAGGRSITDDELDRLLEGPAVISRGPGQAQPPVAPVAPAVEETEHFSEVYDFYMLDDADHAADGDDEFEECVLEGHEEGLWGGGDGPIAAEEEKAAEGPPASARHMTYRFEALSIDPGRRHRDTHWRQQPNDVSAWEAAQDSASYSGSSLPPTGTGTSSMSLAAQAAQHMQDAHGRARVLSLEARRAQRQKYVDLLAAMAEEEEEEGQPADDAPLQQQQSAPTIEYLPDEDGDGDDDGSQPTRAAVRAFFKALRCEHRPVVATDVVAANVGAEDPEVVFAEDDEYDSNAEDHYANDYADESSSSSSGAEDSSDDSGYSDEGNGGQRCGNQWASVAYPGGGYDDDSGEDDASVDAYDDFDFGPSARDDDDDGMGAGIYAGDDDAEGGADDFNVRTEGTAGRRVGRTVDAASGDDDDNTAQCGAGRGGGGPRRVRFSHESPHRGVDPDDHGSW